MREISVLVVDDHPVFRAGVTKLLQTRPDFVVVGEACDGLEAVALAKMLRPDLVVMDVNMPLMGGLDATRIIRDKLPNTMVLLQSAEPPEEGTMTSVGAAAFLAKPLIVTQLISTVKRLLGPSQAAHPG